MQMLTAEDVRVAFLRAVTSDDAGRLAESILIRQGSYCGRHLKLDGYGLIWFQEERQIKFYDADRRVVFSGRDQQFVDQHRGGEQQSQRRAA